MVTRGESCVTKFSSAALLPADVMHVKHCRRRLQIAWKICPVKGTGTSQHGPPGRLAPAATSLHHRRCLRGKMHGAGKQPGGRETQLSTSLLHLGHLPVQAGSLCYVVGVSMPVGLGVASAQGVSFMHHKGDVSSPSFSMHPSSPILSPCSPALTGCAGLIPVIPANT